MDVSIVIRTFNEAKWLPHALAAVAEQDKGRLAVETVIVDSGSTDGTLEVAERFGCRITHIRKEDFTFGRSLNVGCEAAEGDALVFISGHCIPSSSHWLQKLIKPLEREEIGYAYGRQVGHETSKYSEKQLFKKYFRDVDVIPQEGFFCNNANAAIKKRIWSEHRFNDKLTGLEDMELAKRLVAGGYKLGYVAEAPVIHVHEETWHKVRIRYEREAIALQAIMPEVHIGFGDFLRYFLAGTFLDAGQALQERRFFQHIGEILLFRAMQYWGTYVGNNEHRRLSHRKKEEYFYPR